MKMHRRFIIAGITVLAALTAGAAGPPRVGALAPGNDDLASALEIAFQPYTNIQSTVDSSTETGELLAYSGCQGDFTDSGTMGNTVWYKYTHANTAATLQVDTVGPGLVDTVIRVSTGPSSSPTHGALTQVACGDQEWGSFSAALTFPASTGQTYYIQVGGWGGASGTIALNISPILSAAGGRYVVTSNADTGDATPDGLCSDGPGGTCTFREAIQESNALNGIDVISFEAGGGSSVTITPASPLPAMANVVIDARTENAFASSPVVMIDGVSAGCFFADALQPVISPVSIRGFAIARSCANGILLTSGNNIIQGNYLGVHMDGVTDMGNSRGIYVLATSGNVIGGTTPAARNVISGNGMGVFLDGATNAVSNARVIGNYIGTNAAGSGAVPNDGDGIFIDGNAGATGNIVGETALNALPLGGRNLISGNGANGVSISGANATSNSVSGNFIGTNAAGTAGIPNSQRGVRIGSGADLNLIGGGELYYRNLISANAQGGVWIEGAGTAGNQVLGNYIGTDVSAAADLGNGGAGVLIENASGNRVGNVVFAPGLAPGNVISGNVHGLMIYGDGADANEVWGNVVGLNAAGNADLGNDDVGIWVLSGADNNQIGGASSGVRNVVSGNNRGIAIFDSGTTGNVVEGNYAGTNVAGTAAIGNNSEGVGIGYGASGNTVGGTAAGAGNLLSGNGQNGLRIGEGSPSNGNVAEGNYIGTNAAGTAAVANGTIGVWILTGSSGNTIGSGNVISGNTGNGVQIDASNSNTVSGSRIGTNAAGTAAVVNGGNGVTINGSSQNIVGTSAGTTAGGACTGGCNLISGNSGHGVRMNGGSSNHVRSSFLGLDLTGAVDLGNGGDGVRVEGAGVSHIVGGGTASEGNVISGNAGSGVDIRNTNTGGGAVRGNLIGTDSTGTLDRSNDLHGVHLSDNADVWTIGHNILRNVISGHSTGYGVFIEGTSSDHIILGNNIGTNAAGTAALGNGTGIFIDGSSGNQVGMAAFVGNLISGNGRGVWIRGAGASGNTLVRNYIGTNVDGTAALGNSTQGIMIEGAPSNTIGGTVPAERNVISGNGDSGIDVRNPNATANSILGNYIGTNATGTAGVANYNGVALLGSATGTFLGSSVGTTPGGACTGACNLISGNVNRGVFVGGTGGHEIQGNYIGTNASGTGGVGNGFFPLDIFAPNNLIGGPTPAARNIISANVNGVTLVGANNTLTGNYIGVQTDGISPLGNTSWGIRVYGPSPGMVIGGTGADDGNVIAHNAWVGIRLEDSAGTPVNVRIQRNSMFHNAQIGIDLGTDGVTANDTGDGDAGPNNLQNYPVLALSTAGGGTTTISGSLNSAATTQFTIEFYQSFACDPSGRGEGEVFLGQANVTTDGSGNFNFNPALPGEADAGSFITATATDPAGSTSEFSNCIPAVNDGDDDNDGYSDVSEGAIGTSPTDPCGYDGWPSNVFDTSPSDNKLDVQDIISFIAPVRRLDTSPPGPPSNYHPRWDLSPGPNPPFPNHISIYDITTMLNGVPGSPAYPQMLGGPRAFGKECPFPP